MAWKYNAYYKIVEAGTAATLLAETLLQSYPLTRACLGLLGKKLLSQLQFGLFTDETDIIRQGETGKDLFLLCHNTVDVIVDKQKVVQMKAPVLLGDKGIVEPKSTRAATIRVAESRIGFIVKIPMGIFIRNYNNMSYDDAEFVQETGIFYNMFKEIQNRLFDYSFVQKNLLMEVNSTLSLVNVQQTIRFLDENIDRDWGEKIWDAIEEHLAEKLGFTWPDHVPLDISTFRSFLFQHLEIKFPRKSFKGKDSDFVQMKYLLWKKWLTPIAQLVIKTLPADQRPMSTEEVQLFNPRNYQLRIQGLIRAIEKRFLQQKSKKGTVESASRHTSEPEIKSFFGRTERNNTFDLKSYLSSFEKKFELKYPNRMRAQLAQRTAMVAAKAENEFNASIAGMQNFLRKVQDITHGLSRTQTSSKRDEIKIGKEVGMLGVSFTPYNSKFRLNTGSEANIAAYIPGKTPTITDLIRASRSKEVRIEIGKAFNKIISALKITQNLLPGVFVQRNMYVCEVKPGDRIPAQELEKHYWIPISSRICLYCGEENYGAIQPGCIIGGKGWMRMVSTENADDADDWQMAAPKDFDDESFGINSILLVLPDRAIPWERNIDPSPKEFATLHLPIMQWLINKHIEHISFLIEKRDTVFQNWLQTSRILKLDNKVTEFESKRMPITPKQRLEIGRLLRNVTGMRLDNKEVLGSDQLAKKIYNGLLQQMIEDYADIPIEELGNRTYTKWRLFLSEIVRMMQQAEIDEAVVVATPVFEIVETELRTMLENFALKKYRKFIALTRREPAIHLARILEGLPEPEQDRLLVFQLVQSTLETYMRLLMEEIRDYQVRLNKITLKRPQSDIQTLQIETILETAAKLKDIVSVGYATENACDE